MPTAHVEAFIGAGHIPHLTHPEMWVANIFAFHDMVYGERWLNDQETGQPR